MWHFPNRLFCGAISFAIFAALVAGGLSCFGGEAPAQEEQLSQTGKVDHQIVIREHAGWNQDCDAIAHPTLYLDEPPRHGRVCTRIEDIKIHFMYVGTEFAMHRPRCSRHSVDLPSGCGLHRPRRPAIHRSIPFGSQNNFGICHYDGARTARANRGAFRHHRTAATNTTVAGASTRLRRTSLLSHPPTRPTAAPN